MSKKMKIRTFKDILNDPRVSDVSDERKSPYGDNDGIWIYLKFPYYNPLTETTHIHEYTVKECLDILNNSIINNVNYWNTL